MLPHLQRTDVELAADRFFPRRLCACGCHFSFPLLLILNKDTLASFRGTLLPLYVAWVEKGRTVFENRTAYRHGIKSE